MFITTGIRRSGEKVYKPALLAGAATYLVVSPEAPLGVGGLRSILQGRGQNCLVPCSL